MTNRQIYYLLLTILNITTAAFSVSNGNYGIAVFAGGMAVAMLAVAVIAEPESRP